jgi:hypothetical protein
MHALFLACDEGDGGVGACALACDARARAALSQRGVTRDKKKKNKSENDASPSLYFSSAAFAHAPGAAPPGPHSLAPTLRRCMGARRRRLNQQLVTGLHGDGATAGANWLDAPPPPPAHGPGRPRPAGPSVNPAVPLLLGVGAAAAVAWLILRAVLGG